ncbi:hypothetical protein JOE31_003918 [Arthrobacter sp. PvP023]|nr:hypothetical protein [Arthrobacter sp. PvP023]
MIDAESVDDDERLAFSQDLSNHEPEPTGPTTALGVRVRRTLVPLAGRSLTVRGTGPVTSWTAHLLGNLPPGTDHIHQVVFIALSLIGLVTPVRDFFPPHSPPGA